MRRTVYLVEEKGFWGGYISIFVDSPETLYGGSKQVSRDAIQFLIGCREFEFAQHIFNATSVAKGSITVRAFTPHGSFGDTAIGADARPSGGR